MGKNGAGSVKLGEDDPSADVTIAMNDEDWLAVGTGQLNGMQALTTGKLTVEGDATLALKLNDILNFVAQPRGTNPAATDASDDPSNNQSSPNATATADSADAKTVEKNSSQP